MLLFKSGTLTKKEKSIIESLLDIITDFYSDFYITKENLRLYIKENTHLLYGGISKGDKIIYGKEGILFIHGFSDQSRRKYVKILSDNVENASKLIRFLNLQLTDIELYVKIKKENPILKSFQTKGFKFVGDRGKEILLCRKPIKDDFKVNKGDN